MAEDNPEADVFAIPDFWQTSKWLDQLPLEREHASSFFRSNLKESLSAEVSNPFKLDSVTQEHDGFFVLPSLNFYNDENATRESEGGNASTDPDPSQDIDTVSDVWMQSGEPLLEAPKHKTWDALMSKEVSITQQLFISEYGSRPFDALLSWSLDPLRLKNADVPIVDAKSYMTALLMLVLGRESIFFTRTTESSALRAVLPQMRIPGFSKQILEDVEQDCRATGQSISELEDFVQATHRKNSTRSAVAFASVLRQVLNTVREHVSVYGQSLRSMLQLQSTYRGVQAILAPFHQVVRQLQPGFLEENLLSLVFHSAFAADNHDDCTRQIMQETLKRTSAPWMEFLASWIGTRSEDGIPFTKSSVGSSRAFVKVDSELYVDCAGQEVIDVDFCLDREKIPDFMTEELAETMFETGRNLRFIRSAHPSHALSHADLFAECEPPNVEWLDQWDAVQELQEKASAFCERLKDAVMHFSGTNNRGPSSSVCQHAITAIEPFEIFGHKADVIDERLELSMNRFDQPIARLDEDDLVVQGVRGRLQNAYTAASKQPSFTLHWSLLPTLCFGSIASAQAQVVNKETLRLLFAEHGLREHLKLQRDFHLFGNGMFCSLVSHALFDPDMDTAEQHKGLIRQGGVMGLRLGGRENWPPASSELRLALMGVLAETYQTNGDQVASNMGKLPGDLSFAVRDLGPEEVEKCMDPDALEALDFLRLSYQTPPELRQIITPIMLKQYDDIFRFLLRVLRMLFVVSQLFQDRHSRQTLWRADDSFSYRLVTESHHFVTTLAAYFMDTGVAQTWRRFEGKLDKLQADLEDPKADKTSEKVWSPSRVQQMHSRTLEDILQALFLRKRQQPVLKLLEDIFSLILQYARYSRLDAAGRDQIAGEKRTPESFYRDFRKKVQILITVCRSLTEKTRSHKGARDEGLGGESTIAQLLLKLDMYSYYTKK